jgi:DME family drug/metabolite transporter
VISGRRTRVVRRVFERSRLFAPANSSSPYGPVLAVVGAATLFGTTGTALAKGPPGIDALSAGSLRLLIGGAGLCLVGLQALTADLRSAQHKRLGTVFIGCLTVASYQLGFFWATQETGVALSTVVTIGVSPIASRFIGAVRGRPSPDVWWLVSALGLILGLLLLVFGSASGAGAVQFDVVGVFSAILAGASYAAYTEVGSELMIGGWRPTSAMAAMFFGAGLITSPILLVRDVSWFATGSGMATILYLSLVTLTISYLWFGWGLNRLPPTTVVMLTMFEPVVAAVLAFAVLQESLTGVSWFGLSVVLIGLLVVGLRSRPAGATTVAP